MTAVIGTTLYHSGSNYLDTYVTYAIVLQLCDVVLSLCRWQLQIGPVAPLATPPREALQPRQNKAFHPAEPLFLSTTLSYSSEISEYLSARSNVQENNRLEKSKQNPQLNSGGLKINQKPTTNAEPHSRRAKPEIPSSLASQRVTLLCVGGEVTTILRST